ncbi:MAG: RagB/SusD family nutrient uptake outer membrane protein [Bacteroidota bacterium]
MSKRNKIKHLYLFIAVAMAISISGCKKDFLNRNPYDSVPSDVAISNEQDLQAALSGTYANLRSSSLYGRDAILFGDLVADNLYISSNNSNRALDMYQINYTVTDATAEGLWQNAYVTILNANNVINSELSGSAKVDQIRGEALALRAFMYSELLKFFAKPFTVDPNGLGVPLVLQYDPVLKPKRNTTAEVYAQIESDLIAAIGLLNETKSSGFFTKYAAKALLARVYQFKGDWTKALSTAKDVIDNSGYTLLERNEVLDFWANNTDRDDMKEVLFEVVHDISGNASKESMPYLFDQNGYGDALVAESFYDIFSNTDIRKDLITVGSDRRGPDVKVVSKFPNAGAADPDDMKMLRLSEVYFIAAEASYNLHDEAAALDYVNAIATRRDDSFAGYSSTGAALLDDILLERRKELAFEGHRYWDLARNNRDVVRIDVGNNYVNVPLTLTTDDFHRIFPIPQKELDANVNLRDEQNAGY